jgi:hypothetical protein
LLDLVKRGEAAPPPTEVVGTAPEGTVSLTLNSGDTVSISNMGPFVSPEGWGGYVLIYRTARAGADDGLRLEVDEIWQRFVVDVMRAGYDKALIVAKAAEPNNVSQRGSTIFLFKAEKDGWHTDEGPDRIQKGLDADFVKAFMARYDWLVEHHDGIAAALYLSGEWTATVKNTVEGDEKTASIDKDHFIAAIQVVDPSMHDYRHEREILDIAVDRDGKSATIKSRETETLERDGAKIKTVGNSVDILRLADHHVQIEQSFEDAITSADKPL